MYMHSTIFVRQWEFNNDLASYTRGNFFQDQSESTEDDDLGTWKDIFS